jgi:tetratricopeptide (TPR) repeat protein
MLKFMNKCLILCWLFVVTTSFAGADKSRAESFNKCKKCGTKYSRDVKYCGKDGSKLAETQNSSICPKCRQKVVPGEVFCRADGERIVTVEEVRVNEQKRLEDRVKAVEHFKEGNTFLDSENYGKALEEYKKAVELYENIPRLQYNIGLLYGKIGKHKDAIKHLKNYWKLSPDAEDIDRIITKIAILETMSVPSAASGKELDFSSAIEIVKNTANSKEYTLEMFFKNKVSIPAVKDLGWEVDKVYGDYIVKRTIQVDGLRSPTIYKWRVSGKGIVVPLNGHAIGITFLDANGDRITKQKKVTRQSNSAFNESYKDWQPYKDYLQLPDSYHSPTMEKTYKDSYEAEKAVKNLQCSKGGTLNQYFSKIPKAPLDDLGWNVFQAEAGIDVVRTFLLNPSESLETLEYKWNVDPTGKVRAINEEARGITK